MHLSRLILPTLFFSLLGGSCAAPQLAVMRSDARPAPITERVDGPAASAPLTVTRVVHASVLLEAGDIKVLTDPWFTQTSAYNHGEPLALSIEKLPKLTAVVASHGHYDHYDIAAFAAYRDKSVPMIVRAEMADAARAAGFTDVRVLDHWQSVDIGPGLKVTATPAAHGVPESTYVLELAGYTVYFGGDTRFIPELHDIPKKFPHIDLALLAVNGLTVTGAGQMVMNAKEAAQVAALLNAKVAVPMHYTFHGNWFTDAFILSYTGTPAEFVAHAKQLAPATKVHVLDTGAPLVLERAAATEAASASVIRMTYDEARWMNVEHARVAPLVGDPRRGAFFMLIELAGHSISPRHTHTFDKNGMVLQGSVAHVVDGEVAHKALPQHAFFHIAARVPHYTKCLTPEPCVLLYSQPGALDMKVLADDDAAKTDAPEQARPSTH